MLVYRVANLKYRDETLSGIGAEKVGGRWNKIGVKAVYCSENISLALLEYYVHSVNLAFLPESILLAKIHIPDAFEIVELDDLPEGWNRSPYSSKTAPDSRQTVPHLGQTFRSPVRVETVCPLLGLKHPGQFRII